MVVRGGMGTVTSQLAQASPTTLHARPRPAAACGTVRPSRLGVCAGAKRVAPLSLNIPFAGAGCKDVQTVSMPCRLLAGGPVSCGAPNEPGICCHWLP